MEAVAPIPPLQGQTRSVSGAAAVTCAVGAGLSGGRAVGDGGVSGLHLRNREGQVSAPSLFSRRSRASRVGAGVRPAAAAGSALHPRCPELSVAASLQGLRRPVPPSPPPRAAWAARWNAAPAEGSEGERGGRTPSSHPSPPLPPPFALPPQPAARCPPIPHLRAGARVRAPPPRKEGECAPPCARAGPAPCPGWARSALSGERRRHAGVPAPRGAPPALRPSSSSPRRLRRTTGPRFLLLFNTRHPPHGAAVLIWSCVLTLPSLVA